MEQVGTGLEYISHADSESLISQERLLSVIFNHVSFQDSSSGAHFEYIYIFLRAYVFYLLKNICLAKGSDGQKQLRLPI